MVAEGYGTWVRLTFLSLKDDDFPDPVIIPAAPPGAYPQPAPMPPPPYNPFLALGFLGVHSIQNSNSGTGPGLRVGGIGGVGLAGRVQIGV